MPVGRARESEQGFTMIATVLGTSLIALLVLVAVTAVNGDQHVSAHDLEQKQAFEAAKAGIDDYAFHLHANGNYWGLCTEVPEPNAVNQRGAVQAGTAKKRFVPGSTGASYAIELIPAEGKSSCDSIHPTTSMIETSGQMKGTFRIRSTGFAGKSRTSITATFKTASFLDYVYFTQFETSDPVTYGYANPSPELTGAHEQCDLTREENRYSRAIPNTNPAKYCNEILFRGNDAINGPLHTNDTMAICGSPTFGRDSLDVIETSAAAPGYVTPNCTASPTFKSQPRTGVPKLVPPPSNTELMYAADPQFRFKGQVQICLNGSNMTVASVSATNKNCSQGVIYPSGPIPASGLVYVSSGECPPTYSPFTAAYLSTSECGNVYVHGSYSGQLTIAAENDIVIDENVTRTGSGMLGLIANNFVRVFHNYPLETIDSNHTPQCGSSTGEQKIQNLQIDAAILSINHSFIVDHYDCGSLLGTLTVNGAISQKYRGPVGTSVNNVSKTGYTKNYNYDDRLKYLEPPHFIEPEKLPWVIGRETVG
jgi:Tfp pilus assembly protein PilX